MACEFQQIVWCKALEDACRSLVELAAAEDLGGSADWTTAALVDADARGRGVIVSRGEGIIAGLPALRTALETLKTGLTLEPLVTDGQAVRTGQAVARLAGPVAGLLTGERILLNLLGRLSGIATLTGRYVEAIRHTRARVYDTRKTTPGWRLLEKYAVRCGGGYNHRTGLFDAVLIKDNHLALAGDSPAGLRPGEAVRRARRFLEEAAAEGSVVGVLPIEVEIDSVELLEDALGAAPDLVLLDNMELADLKRAVAIRNRVAPEIELEASGGIGLDSIAQVAAAGVDRISVGALTHGAAALDISLEISDSDR